MSVTPTTLHEQLDARGLLDKAHGPGTYALRVETPDSREAVAREWRRDADVLPPDETLERLSGETVAYVGASKNVYERVMDHARGEVRQAALLRVFDVTGLVGVWPSDRDDPYSEEYNRAVYLSNHGWTVWCDGAVV